MLGEYVYGKIIAAIFMTVCAVMDLRHMKINRWIFMVMMAFSLGGYAWMILSGKEILWMRLLIGISVGVLLALTSIITRGKIGMGDAIFFGVVGLVTGCKNVLIFAGSIILCAVISLFICVISVIRGRGIKDKEIPLLPIVWPVGMVILFLSAGMGMG